MGPGRIFAESGLDVNAPRREADAKWEAIPFPEGDLNFRILDDFQMDLREKRGMRKLTGAFDDNDPEHLQRELEFLERKTKKGSKLYRLVYAKKTTDPTEIVITCFGDYYDKLSAEKELHAAG